ncbi:MAG: electron transfer flavoprotein subunit beta/FixA family protein [Syntrophaceae bacterium]|nr:electron transfer flavoprotein subunit beta/FixA family protein [Syntrophaceae bacterium]
MNIVVAMKQIPDLQQIRIRNRRPVMEDVPLTLGKIDRNALEEGLRIRESMGDDSRVIVVSAGTPDVEDTVKEALAAGADEAFIVVDDGAGVRESSVSAALLAEAVRRIGAVDMLLFGEGSGDNYSGQVGPRVAEILDLPQVGYAGRVEMDGRTARITRVLEECEETVEVELPVVVGILADINEPRIPSVTQILKAGKKRREIMDAADLAVETGKQRIETVSNLAPETSRRREPVKTCEALRTALEKEGFLGR